MTCRYCEEPHYSDPRQLALKLEETQYPDDYKRGFETGVSWDANWMPGGPHIYQPSDFRKTKPENRRMAEESKRKSELWHEGFADGLAIRLKDDSGFGDWWQANRHKPICRFIVPEPLTA